VRDIQLAEDCIKAYDASTFGNSRTDTQALLTDHGDEFSLAFRGTSSFRDVVSDVMAYPKKSHRLNRRVHHGIFMGVASVYSEILQKAELLKIQGKALHITGHSLGGGEAALCAAWLKKDGVWPASLATFGAPRIWFWDAGDVLEGVPGNRYTRPLDPVTWVPRLLYKHDREETELPGEGIQHFMRDYVEALKLLES